MTNRFDEVAQLKALPGRREAIIKREQDPGLHPASMRKAGVGIYNL